jgi:hypothetical protein
MFTPKFPAYFTTVFWGEVKYMGNYILNRYKLRGAFTATAGSGVYIYFEGIVNFF